MLTHVHQNNGSFWNAAEMKPHVNRTCFHTGLKSQTDINSFRFSCERILYLLTSEYSVRFSAYVFITNMVAKIFCLDKQID